MHQEIRLRADTMRFHNESCPRSQMLRWLAPWYPILRTRATYYHFWSFRPVSRKRAIYLVDEWDHYCPFWYWRRRSFRRRWRTPNFARCLCARKSIFRRNREGWYRGWRSRRGWHSAGKMCSVGSRCFGLWRGFHIPILRKRRGNQRSRRRSLTMLEWSLEFWEEYRRESKGG